jgi:hypothetical protein
MVWEQRWSRRASLGLAVGVLGMMRGVASAGYPFIVPEDLDQIPWGSNRYPVGKETRSPQLNPGEKTLVLVTVGQSNGANSGSVAYTPTNADKVDNFNIFDGGTYKAVDPLLGCTIRSSATCGNIAGRIADKLINGGYCQRVILVPICYGGTPVARWATGGVLNRRLALVPQILASRGLAASLYIWIQGETDNNPLNTSQAAYTASLAQVIATPGDGVPWMISKCTLINGAVSTAVQAAQDAAPNGINVFQGANLDSLTGLVYRQVDLTHLTGAGHDAGADLFVPKIVAALGL